MATFPSHVARSILSAFLLLTVSVFQLACVKRARDPQVTILEQANDLQSIKLRSLASPININVNVASAKELETLPGIGKSLAERIIEHREKYGPFRRSEHLILVRGISDRRYRAIRNLISVE